MPIAKKLKKTKVEIFQGDGDAQYMIREMDNATLMPLKKAFKCKNGGKVLIMSVVPW